MLREEALPVFIVHRDQPARCVETVRAFWDQDVAVDVTVIDNGSAPEALAYLGDELRDVEIVALGTNRGFGPAANVGFRRWLGNGTGEWAAIAPHDALPEPGCLRRLLEVVDARPGAGLASAVYGEPNVGVWLERAQMKPVVDRYFGSILVAAERDTGWEAAGHPHGTLMIASRRCLLDVGLFDERYFAYCEEADLGIRARSAGWEVGLVWGAVVGNGRPPRADVARYLQLRNTLLLLEKHFGRRRAVARAVWEAGALATGGQQPTLGVGLGSD
ncbi:MAG: glycosyltransferase, partial [Acidimicrobiia bacterium]|nr:glycosyltransferase [Acidimicrobiia bacterium]